MQTGSKRWLKSLTSRIRTVPTPSRLLAQTLQQRLQVVMLVGLLWSASGEAARAASARVSNDPAHPSAVTNAWVALNKGERHWYAFRDEGDGTAITVQMTVLPSDGAFFRVLTPTQANQWLRGEEFTAVGAGTEHPLFNNDFYWTGSFLQSGLYYVLVESGQRGLSNYRLTISGDDISFSGQKAQLDRQPDLCAMNAAPAQPPPTPPAQATEHSRPPPSSAENPLPPVGQSWSIEPGETHWYAFRDEGDEASIQVRADAGPDDCITLQVWTPEQLRLWQLGETFRPIGQGTPNATLKADLFWAGSFVKSGTYYVVVKRTPNASGSCTYQLSATGDDVTLILPPANKSR